MMIPQSEMIGVYAFSVICLNFKLIGHQPPHGIVPYIIFANKDI